MWDRHDLDPFIVQEAKRPCDFQITAGTMQQERKEREKRGGKKQKNPSKNPTTKQLLSKKLLTI